MKVCEPQTLNVLSPDLGLAASRIMSKTHWLLHSTARDAHLQLKLAQSRMLVKKTQQSPKEKSWFRELEQRSPMTKQKSLVDVQVDPNVLWNIKLLSDNTGYLEK